MGERGCLWAARGLIGRGGVRLEGWLPSTRQGMGLKACVGLAEGGGWKVTKGEKGEREVAMGGEGDCDVTWGWGT